MKSVVYGDFSVWLALDKINSLAHICYPIIVLLGCIFWLLSSRNKVCYLGLLGAVILFVSMCVRWIFPEMLWVDIGYKYPQEEQKLIWTLYMYGSNFGSFLFALAFLLYIRSMNKKDQQPKI